MARDAFKTMDEFQRQLWAAALRLFMDGDVSSFTSDFKSSIDTQLKEAWGYGAEQVGVDPDEFTDEDTQKLRDIVQNEYDFVERLAADISDAHNKDIGLDKFTSAFSSRIDLWMNRYKEAVNSAKLWFGNKEKLEWIIGATEKHCPFCERLDGIVAFASEWRASGIQTQNPPNVHLTGEIDGVPGCRGWHCDCDLKTTNKRRTRNALNILLTYGVSQHV